MLSVIIPAYNEEATLETVVGRVLETRAARQVIVVDDGSTDGTGEIVERLNRTGKVVGLRLARNAGKGAAIRTGLHGVTQPYTVIQDADLEYDPSEYDRLLEPIRAGRAEIVFGSRNLRSPAAKKNDFRYLRFWLGGKVVTLAANLLFGARLTDEATCYKLFPTELLRKMNLRSRGFEFCPEVTAKALRMGKRIVEVPIGYTPRSVGEGKKITAMDGLRAIGVLLKYRVMPMGLVATEGREAGIALPAKRRAA